MSITRPNFSLEATAASPSVLDWLISKSTICGSRAAVPQLYRSASMRALLHFGLSALILLAVWAFLIADLLGDTKVDVDLGIAPSQLSVRDNAIWSFPLAFVIWIPCEGILCFLHWLIARRSRARRTKALQ